MADPAEKTEDCAVFPVRPLCTGGDQLFSSRGVKIPEEIGIAGYDNISYAEFSVPRLTTISQNVEQKASLAVEILMERINGVEKERENEIELPVTLIPRKSVQPQDEN